MLGAERLGIQRRVGDRGGRLRLEGNAAGDGGRLLLRSRERCPELQENNHKHETDAHDFLPAVLQPPTPRRLAYQLMPSGATIGFGRRG